MNFFPSDTGISLTMSPSTIINGTLRPDFIQRHIAFGAYTLVHTGTENNTTARDIPAIALKPLNKKGAYIFMRLLSGLKIRGVKWTQLPILDKVINRVEEIALEDDMLLLD